MNKLNIIIIAALAGAIAIPAFAGNDFITNDLSKPVPVTQTGALPSGATAKTGSSGNVANGSAAASLGAVAAKTNYITGFQVTASGATTALPVSVTVTGLISGTATYTFVFPAGVLVGATPLIVPFNRPVAASGTNTAITVTLPASGAGGTNAAVDVQGFDQ